MRRRLVAQPLIGAERGLQRVVEGGCLVVGERCQVPHLIQRSGPVVGGLDRARTQETINERLDLVGEVADAAAQSIDGLLRLGELAEVDLQGLGGDPELLRELLQ